jgi:hypothetical protein
VRTDSVSTSIRETVEGESVCSSSGGAGARFCGGVSDGFWELENCPTIARVGRRQCNDKGEGLASSADCLGPFAAVENVDVSLAS